MKKILAILLVFTTVLSVGCASNSSNEDTSNGNVTVNEGEIDKKEDKKQPPVTIEEVPLNITINEPNSIGTIYMDATFTNNSQYPIKGFQATVLLKENNEKTYLSNYDTVLPGETSPVFSTFGPSTTDLMEILDYEISVIGEDGNTIYLDYDCKLKKYEWF